MNMPSVVNLIGFNHGITIEPLNL